MSSTSNSLSTSLQANFKMFGFLDVVSVMKPLMAFATTHPSSINACAFACIQNGVTIGWERNVLHRRVHLLPKLIIQLLTCTFIPTSDDLIKVPKLLAYTPHRGQEYHRQCFFKLSPFRIQLCGRETLQAR